MAHPSTPITLISGSATKKRTYDLVSSIDSLVPSLTSPTPGALRQQDEQMFHEVPHHNIPANLSLFPSDDPPRGRYPTPDQHQTSQPPLSGSWGPRPTGATIKRLGGEPLLQIDLNQAAPPQEDEGAGPRNRTAGPGSRWESNQGHLELDIGLCPENGPSGVSWQTTRTPHGELDIGLAPTISSPYGLQQAAFTTSNPTLPENHGGAGSWGQDTIVREQSGGPYVGCTEGQHRARVVRREGVLHPERAVGPCLLVPPCCCQPAVCRNASLARSLWAELQMTRAALNRAVGVAMHLEADLGECLAELVDARELAAGGPQGGGLPWFPSWRPGPGQGGGDAIDDGLEVSCASSTSSEVPGDNAAHDFATEDDDFAKDLMAMEDRFCRACEDETAVAVVLPCRHLALCKSCCKSAEVCPVCSTPVLSYICVNTS